MISPKLIDTSSLIGCSSQTVSKWPKKNNYKHFNLSWVSNIRAVIITAFYFNPQIILVSSPGLVLAENRTLRCATFFYLYLMQGIPAGFAFTALANYFIAEGISSQAVGKFIAIIGLPWALQFIWGPVIDRFQNFAMGRAKPWVLLAQILSWIASLGILLINNPAKQITMLSVAFFVHSIFASLQDASADAMAITVTPVEERGRVNAFMRGGMLLGSSLGAVLMAFCMRNFGFYQAALLQSFILLVFTLVTFFIKEKQQDVLFSWPIFNTNHYIGQLHKLDSIGSVFRQLFKALVSTVSLRTFGAIAVVYTCLSIFIRTFNVHLIQELHWSDTYLSALSSSYVGIATLIVVFVGGILADRMGAGKLLMIVMLVISSYLLVFNMLAPFWDNVTLSSTALMLWYLFDPGFSIAAMPLLMNICRKGIEGSQFTTYMSFVNLCDVAGAYISGYALLWLSASSIGILCGLLTFAALLFVFISQQFTKVKTM